MPVYGYNDWRDYQRLEHAWGTSPKMKAKEKAYNAEYYQEHRDEILAKLKEKKRNSYDYKDAESTDDYEMYDKQDKDTLLDTARNKGLTDSMSEMDVFADADEALKNANLPADVLENIRKNNENVRNNIAKLYETVENYVAKNADKLSRDDIAKMYNDATKQASLELKRVIDVSSAEGKEYVSGGSSKKKSSSSSKKATATSNTSNTSSSTNTSKKTSTSPIDEQVKKYSSGGSGGRDYGAGGGSNMPTNQTDLETIRREQERQRNKR